MWKTRKKSRGSSKLSEPVARYIAGAIVSAQQKIAAMLQRWERHYSAGQKKVMLLAFCLCCSAWCGMVLLNAVTHGAERKILPALLQLDTRPPGKALPAVKAQVRK